MLDLEFALLQAAFEEAPDGVAILRFSEDGKTLEPVWLNRAYSTRTGYSREDLLRRGLGILRGPQTDARTLDLAVQYLRRGEDTRVRTTLYQRSGEPYVTEIQARPIIGYDPGTYVVFVDRDVTGDELVRVENYDFALHAERVRRLHDIVALGRGEEQQIAKVLEFAADDLGYERAFVGVVAEDEVEFRYVLNLSTSEAPPDWVERGERRQLSRTYLQRAIGSEALVVVDDLTRMRNVNPRPHPRWKRYLLAPVFLRDEPYGVIGMLSETPTRRNLTEHDKDFVSLIAALIAAAIERGDRERRLDALAFYDALTGLPNRVLLLDRLNQTLAASRRHKRTFAVHALDLDGFKGVNDTGGHAAGDAVLKMIARRLSNVVRESDTLARIGGDEFVVVQPVMNDQNDAVRLGERIVEALSAPISVQRREYRVGISVGIVTCKDGDGDAQTLLQAADVALYGAKQAGRSRVHVFAAEDE